jgi:putative transposase
MARRRHTPEQIIRKLREADRLLAEGAEIADVARHLEVSEQTYHRWRNQFGGMKADDARRLKDLERENRELKQIVADKELENRALREIAKGTGEPVEATPRRGHAGVPARPLAAASVSAAPRSKCSPGSWLASSRAPLCAWRAFEPTSRRRRIPTCETERPSRCSPTH